MALRPSHIIPLCWVLALLVRDGKPLRQLTAGDFTSWNILCRGTHDLPDGIQCHLSDANGGEPDLIKLLSSALVCVGRSCVFALLLLRFYPYRLKEKEIGVRNLGFWSPGWSPYTARLVCTELHMGKPARAHTPGSAGPISASKFSRLGSPGFRNAEFRFNSGNLAPDQAILRRGSRPGNFLGPGG